MSSVYRNAEALLNSGVEYVPEKMGENASMPGHHVAASSCQMPLSRDRDPRIEDYEYKPSALWGESVIYMHKVRNQKETRCVVMHRFVTERHSV
jgi:hypothetical protein